MKKHSPHQTPAQAEPILTEPFASVATPPELQWPPRAFHAREMVQTLYTVAFGVQLPLQEAEMRGKNFGYRATYPEDGIGYREAVRRVLEEDDEETFLKLVRRFGRDVEEHEPCLRAWFHTREAQAHQERDYEFLRRYEEARRTPVREQMHKQHLRRLFLLAVFEPELRNEKRKTIMAFLQWWHDLGALPQEQLFPSLGSLKTYLSTRMGWKKVR